KRSTATMCTANSTAQASTQRSPGASDRLSLQSTLKSARPTVATPMPSHVSGGVERLETTAASTATNTTFSDVMKPALEAVVNCKPNVWVKYPPQRNSPSSP